MITAIGQTSAGSANLWPVGASTGTNADLALIALGTGASADANATGLLRRPQQDIVQLGFGQGTVSVPGVAVRTINKNMQDAKRLTTRDITKSRKVSNRQTQQSSAVNQALGVVAAMSRSAQVTEARLVGEKPPSDTTTATLTINGQSISYVASARQASDTSAGATRLNILV
ncbi:MAG: hypothetical protein NTU83_05315 [Candidatus Hydrogenedentes bacterium]|nr:hypothetical protein [Candidatus Hydrogenedentota bacterium]